MVSNGETLFPGWRFAASTDRFGYSFRGNVVAESFRGIRCRFEWFADATASRWNISSIKTPDGFSGSVSDAFRQRRRINSAIASASAGELQFYAKRQFVRARALECPTGGQFCRFNTKSYLHGSSDPRAAIRVSTAAFTDDDRQQRLCRERNGKCTKYIFYGWCSTEICFEFAYGWKP